MPVAPLFTAPHLLEVSHVAFRLSKSDEYVRRLIRAKQLPAIRLGKRYRVDVVDLLAFIDAHREGTGVDLPDRGGRDRARRKSTTHPALQVVTQA